MYSSPHFKSHLAKSICKCCKNKPKQMKHL